MPLFRRAHIATLVFLCLMLASCGSAPELKRIPFSTLTPGWKRIERPAEKFSVDVPEGWQEIDAAPMDDLRGNPFRDFADEFPEQMKSVAKDRTITVGGRSDAGLVLFVIHKEENLNPNLNADDADKFEKNMLKNAVSGSGQVDLPVGKAFKTTALHNVTLAPNAPQEEWQFDVYLLRDKTAYYWALFGRPKGQPELVPSMDILGTFRVK